MKRLILLFLLVSLAVNLSACTVPEDWETEPGGVIQVKDPTEEPTVLPETEPLFLWRSGAGEYQIQISGKGSPGDFRV